MKEPVLIVMAAGMGSRYGGLKQMDPVGSAGELIIDFSLYDAVMAGFKKVIFIIKKEMEEDFRALVDDKAGKFIEIEYAFQDINDLPDGFTVPEGRVKPWGTCHAVLSCKDKISGPFAVINADDYYGAGAFQSMYEFLEKAEDKERYCYAMVGYRLENTLTENGHVARGVCETSPEGYLTGITERTKIMWRDGKIQYTENDTDWVTVAQGTTVSMNFWGFTPSMMTEMEERFPAFLEKAMKENPLKAEYFLPLAVDQLLKENKADIKVLESADRWYGVTYRDDKESVIAALQSMKDKGFYPEKLWG
ncbi:nucleotidyltransferase family protein [Sinanaerobacter chloroacetimidivorans]|jgi:NDP-sugar pyrophosphorylase family protein|uniref:Nucleotidyltransferase n=1 Tax=Sinanaerobacter chloroacetimidivorans TaxID=2818044 RepID=A0A8J7W3R4_9FIRM|nr:sugar phosphate nucleotidyltransferase [Sinanaerobacter chloroacetimidivorans]MBR0598385.1 nucleotidyltransferase [Sinanaerobacter chloroacetimidivorans]